MNAPRDLTLTDPDVHGDEAGADEAPAAVAEWIGGKYRLERSLAAGGMGQIWVAHDDRLRRRVAIKLLHQDDRPSPRRLDRFELEARTIASLQHPNVVQVYDYGVADNGTPFMAMELLDGEDVARQLRRTGPLPLRAIEPLVVQAAKGLHAAHRVGIVHRDLKPANLFVARQSGEQTLKILDFGVAAVRHATTVGHGDTASLIGTPSYMSPEQARGNAVDHRSDLWSLAVVAYECLTGISPFAGTTLHSTVAKILSGPLVPPSQHTPSLGPVVDEFFARALAKDRNERFSSALELAAEFSALAAAQEVQIAKILVVDDEPDLEDVMRQRFRKKLRRGEVELMFAANGNAALEKLGQRPDIDVVLTDINMPGMDGLTLLNRLGRAGPALRSVVVSAYGDMPNIRAAMNAGAYDFLTKPIDFSDLDATVDKAIREARGLRRALRSIEENDALRLFVDDNLVERLLPLLRVADEVSAEAVEATIVSIDVCGVRERIRNDPASVVFDLLNRSFDVVVPLLNTYKGAVLRFVGDAVLAVFQGDDHLLRASSACFAVRGALSELSLADPQSPDALSGVSMGLDSGRVLSGSIGSKAIQRLDYTVLGPAVSGALTLEHLAARGQILVRAPIAELIDPMFHCRALELETELGTVCNLERPRNTAGTDALTALMEQATVTIDG